jgi:EmrB/QacA subfamily drug resistance transporter
VAPLTPRPTRPFGIVVAAASVPMFMATLDNLVMTNALPVLHRDLGASVEELQWFVNAYTLAFAAFILVASALGDRFGRRSVFVAGIALFGIGSVLAALSVDPTQLIGARAVQGVGAAGVMPLSLALVASGVDAARRPLAIGIWGGISGLGVAVGPLVGGAVMEGWNWQAIFWINVPIALVAIPFALWALGNGFGARARVDVVGALLAGTGVLALVHAIVRGNDDGWARVDVIGELAAGALLLVAFVAWQTRTRSPLVPLRLFRDRSFSITNAVGFAFSFGTFGAVFLLIQFLQVVQGSTPLEAAVQTTPWTLAPMVIAPLAGMIAPRVGTRALLLAGLVFQGVALGWIAAVMSPDVAYATLVAPFVLAGVGMGLVFAPSATALLATLGVVDHATASGVNSTVREIGLALGTAVMTAIFVGGGGELLPDRYVDAARPAVFVGAAVLLVAAVVAVWLPSGRSARTGVDEAQVPAASPAAAASRSAAMRARKIRASRPAITPFRK